MSKTREKEMKKDKHPQAETGNRVTRREFMKTVGLGGAALGLAGVGSSAGATGEGSTKGKPGAEATKRRLKLTMAFSDNPRVQPLKEGAVRAQNIDLEVVTLNPSKIFYRNLHSGPEFDVSEMSISETLLAKERSEAFGKGRWGWTPIPVFLSRGLFWAALYVSTSSGIKQLADLRGKRIGVPDYCMTAALWFKITLKDLYGIEAWDNIWFNGRTPELSHGGELGLNMRGHGVAKGVSHRWLTVDQTLDVMLDRGELDAIFPPSASDGITAGNATIIDRYGGTPMSGNPRIRGLLNDEGKAAIYEFFRKTGCHQPNHHVIIKNSILREHPWVAMELYKAFQQSKELAYERARRAQSTYLYFEGHDWKEQAAVFGEDPYPLGLRAMRKTVERAIQGSLEQGLITKPTKIEDLYFSTTLDT
ncbi:MAG TPA: twin-arginine translocation signal domain-containing protein [Syntrophorhabdales bacterium]|nr:twin-arginine translocation signal domain-containing protein [Syntrophorhabdales bacterium]